MTTINTTAPQSQVIRLARLLAPYRVTDARAARRLVHATQVDYAASTVVRRRVVLPAAVSGVRHVPAARGTVAASAAH